MFDILRRRRERKETERQAWIAKWQDIFDPALHQRVIDATDRALATAPPGLVDTDVTEGISHVSTWWTCHRFEDTSAQRTTHPDGINYQIFVEQADPDDGAWVLVSTRPDRGHEFQVRWMPGQGFETVEQFLSWFELS